MLIQLENPSESNFQERIRSLAEKLNGENQQLQVWKMELIKLMKMVKLGKPISSKKAPD